MAHASLVQREAMIISDFQQSLVTTREPSPRVTVLLRQEILRAGSVQVTGVDRWRHDHKMAATVTREAE